MEYGENIPEDYTLADVDEPVSTSVDSETESDRGSSDGQKDDDFINQAAISQTSRSGRKIGQWCTQFIHSDFVTY